MKFTRLLSTGEWVDFHIGRKGVKTYCHVSYDKHNVIYVWTVKHPKDKMDKRMGRLIAFKRAMANFNSYSREDRKKLWDAYNEAEKRLQEK